MKGRGRACEVLTGTFLRAWKDWARNEVRDAVGTGARIGVNRRAMVGLSKGVLMKRNEPVS